jgi:glycosyltransferase involved in cell wall biosynthesis
VPLLSIVVPYFNVERYIAECLESLRRQTLRDVEVILVDDGSLDGSRERAVDFCDRDDRFRIVTQENQGLGPARNTGAQHATGEFLTFVDSDDVLALRTFETVVDRLRDTGSDFASFGAGRFNNLGVFPSLVQSLVCGTSRSATHVSREPVLALDRMAWDTV